ncbi:MAG TPA: hypothetical protein VGK38_04205 [Prolixibacteraceae bacterium]|jgi:hypothetical protein
MRKRIIEILLIASVFIWANWYASLNLQTELYGIVVGGVMVLLIELIDYLIKEWDFLKLYWDCYKPWTEKEIRLTIAYLFRIEINGKYLLVKSNRIANTYQPIGGVYKYYNPEAKRELDCMGAITDNKIDNDDKSECDLRLNLLNRKKMGTFLKWFFKGENRESDPWREFYEELVVTGILSAKEFGYIHYELVGQLFDPIHRDKFFNVDTFKYTNIFIPKFVTNRQIEEVKKLRRINSTEYIWVTQQEISQGKSADNHLIAEHTHKIFHNKILHQ